MVLILGLLKRLLDKRAIRRVGNSFINPRRSSYPFGVRALQLERDGGDCRNTQGATVVIQQPCHALLFDRRETPQDIVRIETSPAHRGRSSQFVRQLPITHDLDLDYLVSTPRFNIAETGQLYRRAKPPNHSHVRQDCPQDAEKMPKT